MKNVILYTSLVWFCGCVSEISANQNVDATDSAGDIDIGDATSNDATSDVGANAVVDSVHSDSAMDSVVDTRDAFCSSVSFGPMTSYSTGTNGPSSVDLADLTNTGNLSILETNNANYLGVFFNAGSGVFGGETTYATGKQPSAMTTGDFNGDGFVDVAVANSGDANVGVFINNSHGGFLTQVTYAVGGAVSLVAGDFDGDGVLDLAVGDNANHVINLLLGSVNDAGKGDGTFKSDSTFATGIGDLGALIAANFSGHALPDLAIAGPNVDTVGVMFNTGGGFSAASTYAIGSYVSQIAVGDFNRDGHPDFAVAFSRALGGSDGLSVMIGNGTGVFEAQTTTAVGGAQGGIAVGDFNGDGLADLAVVTGASLVTVWINSGADVDAGIDAGLFPFSAPLTYSMRANYANTIAVGDIDGDSRPDIVVGSNQGLNVGVLLAHCP